jgi:hypothetical protein
MADQSAASEVAGTVTKPSPLSDADTVSRIEAVLSTEGIKPAANLAAIDPMSDAVTEQASE